MNAERLNELVAYSIVCFNHCTNPFESVHLRKKKVKSSECVDLSHYIASCLEEFLTPDFVVANVLAEAEKEFQSTQG